MATKEAVDQAKRLNEIRFPEFTAKLIGDTFDALVMANLKQTESYISLVQQVSKSLSAYINETKDDTTGAEILSFLEAILPAVASDTEHDTSVRRDRPLSKEQADTLNKALAVPEEVADQPATYQENEDLSDDNKWQGLLDAIAVRIAANKYTLLQEMVKQGILRLVVENGTIETRLIFTTFGSQSYSRDASYYQRDKTNKRSSAGAGFILAPLFSAKQSTESTTVTVTTTKESSRDISGSRVQIYGGVTINFKTDYQPL